MNFALDIVLICILAVFMLVGVKRGLIKSLVHLLGSVVAMIISTLLGGMLAQWIFDSLFRNALVERIDETIVGVGAVEAVKRFLDTIPDFLLGTFGAAGVSEDSLVAEVSRQQGEAAQIIADMISPVFISFIKVFVVIVLFMLFSMVIRVLAGYVDSLFDLPILSQVNSILGGVCGLLLAVVIIWVVLSAVNVFIPMMADEAQETWNTSINGSTVARILAGFNPFTKMFK